MVFVRCDRGRVKAVLAAAVLLGSLGTAGCGGGDGPLASDAPGVTREPCPRAIDKDHGCIYLGSISDLSTGPFTSLGVAVTQAQRAFWERVNRQGGIGGYEIDVTTHVEDNHYDVATHARAFKEIKGKVLALAQTLGSPQTDAILGDLRSEQMIALPLSFISRWEFEDNILESGASYCVEGMNGVDHAVQRFGVKSVMAVHYPGDYGEDAAAGAEIAAARHGMTLARVPTGQGPQAQDAAVQKILKQRPDLVVLTTGPADAAVIVKRTVDAGFKGRFVGSNPSWDESLLSTPAAAALKARFLQVAPWKPYAFDSPGHSAMRRAIGPRVKPNNSFTSGWVISYPLKAVLERAVANKELTREGLLRAVRQITHVDYEGMLPREAGNSAGTPNDSAFRQSVIGRPDDHQFTGVKVLTDFEAGPTAREHRFDAPCAAAK